MDSGPGASAAAGAPPSAATSADLSFDELRRREFAPLERGIFMNAASYGPLPLRSLAAVCDFQRARHEVQRLDADRFAETLARARRAAAALVGTTPDQIALQPNTTYGLNAAADIVRARAAVDGRRTVLFSDREFPANVYPWLALDRMGLRAERVRTDRRGCPREDALVERVKRGDVAALAISFVQFATGYRADLERLGRVCREQDTLLIVDAIQGLGAVPLDVRDAPIDLLACGAQKWLCSPWATGFLWLREDLARNAEPAIPGWLAFEASQDFTSLLDYRYELVADARRFETGSLSFADFAAFASSLELFVEIGVQRVWERIREVQRPLLDWVAEREDARIVGDPSEARRSGIICVSVPEIAGAHRRLEAEGVICVLREGAIRLSPHVYNTPDEMRRVVSVLDRA